MAFCKFCGKEIPDGAQCDCEEAKTAASNPSSSVTSASSEEVGNKSSNNASLVMIAGLIIVLIIIVSLISSIAGGGYKKPVNLFEKAFNKADAESFAECMYTDEFLDKLDDSHIDELSKTLDWAHEMCEEEFGKKVKISIDIEDKEKLSKSEIKELEKDYKSIDKKVKITKAYELDCTMKIKGKKDKDEQEVTLTVVKIKGEGWKLNPDFASDILF